MKKVRRDVINKLIRGLFDVKQKAKEMNSSIPKQYHYSTPKAEHYIVETDTEYWCNSTLYDGTQCHSTVKKFNLI